MFRYTWLITAVVTKRDRTDPDAVMPANHFRVVIGKLDLDLATFDILKFHHHPTSKTASPPCGTPTTSTSVALESLMCRYTPGSKPIQ